MEYRVVFLIESKTDHYDLLTEDDFDAKDDNYWDEWNWLSDEINLAALSDACQRRGISNLGIISTTNEPHQEFANYLYCA